MENCLFHHMELRKLIALLEREMKMFSRICMCLSPVYSVVFSDQSCTLGTSVDILAFSSLFQVDVYIASDTYYSGTTTWLKYSP